MTEQGDAESYHGYSVDSEDQPQSGGDDLVEDRGLDDPLDEGYSPPKRWSAARGYGNTPREEAEGEDLEQRLDQEVPDSDPYADAAVIDEGVEGEVGDARAGRLVEDDEGARPDTDQDMAAEDVGVDGAGAEEAAVHVIDEDA